MANNNKPRAVTGSLMSGPAVPALRYAHIVGWGMALPEQVLTNHDMEAIVDTDDEWIRSRTGIQERRIANESETTTQLAFRAAKKALEVANILPTDVDLIVVATSTPEHIFPSTASLVQDLLGASHAGAYDLSAACSGFVYALDMAGSKVRTGDVEIAIVIGAETMSRVMDWTDRGTCILFGDGAGAVVLQGKSEPGGILSSELRSDGAGWDMLGVPTVGSLDTYLKKQVESDDLALDHPRRELHRLHMNGREVFKFATRVVGESIKNVVRDAHLELEDVALVVPHQANQRILDHVAKQLKMPEDKFYSNVSRYGNTSAASIPIALCEAVEGGQIKPEDNIVMIGFGGGLTWASAVVRWSAIETEESRKLMNMRRSFIYRYAVWRRNVQMRWRRFVRAMRSLGRPQPKEAMLKLKERLEERDW